MVLGNRRLRHRGQAPLLRAPGVAADFAQSALRLERMARTLPHGAPWDAPRADSWDATTLGAWLRGATVTASARALWSVASGLTMGGVPDDVSLLFALHHLRGAGGVTALLDVEGGAQELRLEGGAVTLSERLTNDLGPVVQVDTPVTQIDDRGGEVLVAHRLGSTRAGHVIVAMSPADAGRITWTSGLPRARRRLHQRLAMVSGLKVQAVYPHAFWRDAGLSGQGLADTGPVPVCFDNSPPAGRPGILVGFTTYDRRTPLALDPALEADADARRAAVLRSLARFVGERALHPDEYVEQDWGTEPHVRGCIPSMPPGLLTEAGRSLAAPVGRVHWAGAESAPAWDGYMEGAIRAGERAAVEVL